MNSSIEERVVLCMKWGSLYPASYVNVLYSAVKENLDKPFRFVCLTNEPEGLNPEIEHLPLPELDLPPDRYSHGAWPKLGVFKKDLYGLQGRCLFIDLDSVINGSLEPFFEMDGDLIAIGAGKNWGRTLGGQVKQAENVSMGTGVFAFTLGSQPQILNAFLADKQKAYGQFMNEQQLVEHYATSWAPWPAEWVISFKRHLRRPVLIDRLLPPRRPDSSNLIVAFHGDPRPIDVVGNGRSGWSEFPHYWSGPVDWVREYWDRHSR